MAFNPSRLRPSDAARWVTCKGAINLCDKLKAEDKGNFFTAEGTFAHGVRETCLYLGFDTRHMIGWQGKVEGYDFTCDEDMADFLQPGIDQINAFGGHLTVEHKVNLDRWMPGQTGTLDAGIATPTFFAISDLKYGAGQPVDPYENWQQIIYAGGFWDNIGRHLSSAKEFLIIIDQPRMSNGGGEWRVSLKDLLELLDIVKRAAKETLDPDAPRCASAKACHWCPASKIAGACPEHEAFVMSIIDAQFDDLDPYMELGIEPKLTDPNELTPERRTFIIQNRHVFVNWLDRLRDDAVEDALAGRPVYGMKLVNGRAAPRKYSLEKKQLELELLLSLGNDGFKQVPKTPKQIADELGSDAYNKIADLVISGNSKPQLVSMEDARPPLTSSVALFDFDEE